MLRKRMYPGLLLILLTLSLLGCGPTEEDISFHFDGDLYVEGESNEGRVLRAIDGEGTIAVRPSPGEDWDASVMIDGEAYLISGSANSFRVRFPDGRVLRRSHRESGSSGTTEAGTSARFDDWDRVDELGTLVFGAPDLQREDRRSRSPLPGLLLLTVGLLSAIKPEISFFLDLGWRLRSAEPSEAYLVITRIVGFGMAVAGLLLLVAR